MEGLGPFRVQGIAFIGFVAGGCRISGSKVSDLRNLGFLERIKFKPSGLVMAMAKLLVVAVTTNEAWHQS